MVAVAAPSPDLAALGSGTGKFLRTSMSLRATSQTEHDLEAAVAFEQPALR
jgi:hypothetical protein